MPEAVSRVVESMWITKCRLKLIYETLPAKEVVYVLPITSILGRLPVVRASDTGTPFSYCNGCCAHRYNHALAKACWCLGLLPHVLGEFLVCGWSRDL